MSWHGPSAPRVEGIATKSRGGGKLRVEAGVDGIEDSLLGIGVHCRFLVPRERRCRRSKHTSTDLVEGGLPFRITDVPIQFAAASRPAENRMPDNRNVLYLIIGVLIVAVGVLGYNLYQAKKQPEGLQINVGPGGLKIQSK